MANREEVRIGGGIVAALRGLLASGLVLQSAVAAMRAIQALERT
jgi:hypothetical protein